MKNKLKTASKYTWKLLEKSKIYQSKIGEETVTELLQLYLSHFSKKIRIKTFTKIKESKIGADWDWWFINPKKQKYLGIRVQAKIIDPNIEIYKYLHYMSGRTSQTYKLQKSSVKDSMIPLYALYTYWSSSPKLKYNNEVKEHFGISLLTIDCVLKLKKNKPWLDQKETLIRLSPDLVPLYKLLDSFNVMKSLPECVFSNIQKELNPRKGMFSRSLARPGVKKTAPPWIMQLLKDSSEESIQIIDEILTAKRTILFIEED
jgi:hypothetical protein